MALVTEFMETLHTQEEIVDLLRREGFRVSTRTLTHWRTQGLLPPLWREGNKFLCEPGTLDTARTLCSINNRSQRPNVVYSKSLEGKEFIVEKVEVRRIGLDLKKILYVRGGGFLFEDMTEEQLDAVREN